MPKVILLIERSRAFGRGLLVGIAQYSNLHGPWLFCMEPEFYRKGTQPSYEWMRDLHATGIIAHVFGTRVMERIVGLGLPALICGIQEPTVNAYPIITDNVAIGRTAAEYFLRRGFRRFAYCGFDDMVWSRQRGESFSRVVAELDLEVTLYQTPKAKRRHAADSEPPFMADWLRSLPKPIAVMACNDDRSRDVLAACKIAGIRVPAEVAILGVDNDDLVCGLSYPRLSSIALSTQKAGYEAARVLDGLMLGQGGATAGEEVPVSPLQVVTRQSTDVMAIEDREVAEAVHFVRQHSKEPIQVGDVAEAVGLSRRALEQRFRRVLSHSVHEEIRDSRVDQMAEMLMGTSLSVLQIARLMRYPDASNISRYFKQVKGTSPSGYRKKFGPR